MKNVFKKKNGNCDIRLISKRQMPYLANDSRFEYHSFNMKKNIKSEKCIFKIEIVISYGLFPRDKCLISLTIYVLDIIPSI